MCVSKKRKRWKDKVNIDDALNIHEVQEIICMKS